MNGQKCEKRKISNFEGEDYKRFFLKCLTVITIYEIKSKKQITQQKNRQKSNNPKVKLIRISQKGKHQWLKASEKMLSLIIKQENANQNPQ